MRFSLDGIHSSTTVNARRAKRLLVAALALGLAASLGGPASAEIRIAVVGPLTGQAIFRGEQVQQGAQMAVADLNAEGGVLGEKLRLLVADDACDAEQAVAVADKLVIDGVLLVAGHVCSHASIPASKVYEKAGVLMISPASTNPRLTDEGGANVFRVSGRDDEQGRIAGDLLAERWPEKRIAIVHDGTVYGEGLAELTKARLNELGLKETLFAAYAPGESDYSALVGTLLDAGAEVLYVGGYPAEAGLILREAAYQGLDLQLVGGDSLTTEEFWLVAGPAGEGTMVTFGPDPRLNREAGDVVRRFRAQGFEPAGYTLHTYAAVQAWAQAVEAARSLDLSSVIEALREGRFETVLGTVGFDEKGDVSAPGFVWYVWRSGDYVRAD